VRRSGKTLGNFWVDLTRATLWVLLPISVVFALVLVWQGVPDNFSGYTHAKTLEGSEQVIAQGPVASQEIIKELGTNGGGFFNSNSAHPYENPTPLTNLIELIAIFAIGAALTHTFGQMAGDRRQGWALFGAMAILFLVGAGSAIWAEQRGNPQFARLAIDQRASTTQSGGNMEGKEVRFGIVNSGLWATVTTDTSCGAVNSMHDSYTPLGGLVPIVNMQIGEIIFGGVGFRALRYAGDGGPVGVYRRAHGRPNSRVPGQEDRRARNETRNAVHPDLPGSDSASCWSGGGDQGGARRYQQSGPAWLFPNSVCLHRSVG
jgi:potassium-transporting ATPase potassium-binding subunit